MHIVEGGIQKYHLARNKRIGKFTLNQVSIPKDSQSRWWISEMPTLRLPTSIDLTAMLSIQAEEPILHLVHGCMFHMSQVKVRVNWFGA